MSRLSLYFSSDSSLGCKLKRISCIMVALRWMGNGDIKYAAVGNPLPNTNTFSIPSMMLRVCVLWNLKAVIMPSFWALFLGSNVHVRRPLATNSTSLLFTGDEKISSTLYLHCATYTAQRRCACLPRRWEIVPSAFTSKACPRKTCPLEAHF